MVSRENSLLSMCSRERFSPGPSSEECVALVPKNKLTHVAINLIGCPGRRGLHRLMEPGGDGAVASQATCLLSGKCMVLLVSKDCGVGAIYTSNSR